MKNFIRMSLLAAVAGLSSLAHAGLAVVAHPSVAVSALSAEQVSQIYMGRATSLPGGAAVTPIDMPEGSPLRVQFASRVLGKNEQQLRSYWSRMIFTGKGQPPRSVASQDDVLRMVAATPGAIGYVDSKAVTPKVKVLFQVD